jgi:hypothetical protein
LNCVADPRAARERRANSDIVNLHVRNQLVIRKID